MGDHGQSEAACPGTRTDPGTGIGDFRKRRVGLGDCPLNRGNMPVSGAEAARYFTEAGYVPLPITADHAAATGTLPRLHADPFDRILIAQAITEPLRLMTCDASVAKYGDLMLPV